LWIKILGYIGISTSQIIAIFVCEFGSGIIIMNEKNPNTSKII